jgi:hypothetical protein
VAIGHTIMVSMPALLGHRLAAKLLWGAGSALARPRIRAPDHGLAFRIFRMLRANIATIGAIATAEPTKSREP